ncbi:Glycerophosphoryl diester phosphodiesterase [compost metagenome]
MQLSKDNELIVIHDQTFERTSNGSGPIGDLTLEEIRKLDAGSWFHEKFAGERIPTLGEVLELCRGKIGVLIEIKCAYLYPGIEQKLADELIARRMHIPTEERVVVQSFELASVQRFHAINSDIPVGLLVSKEMDLDEDKLTELAVYADYFNPLINLVTDELVELIHAKGLKIFTWTVRSRDVVPALLKSGVDGIITDYPDYIE